MFNLEEKKLIFIQALVYFGYALANVFVNIFFFSHSNLRITLFYNLVTSIVLLLFYFLSGWSLKKFSSGTLIKTGIFAWAIFYLLMIYLKNDAIQYVLLLGFLNGFAGGNFWAGFNLNQYIYTNREKRVEYFGSATGILSFLQAIAPFIGGFIITFTNLHKFFGGDAGYELLFSVVFLIFAAAFFVVGELPAHQPPKFSYKDMFYHKRSRQWKLVLCQQTVYGLFDITFGVVAGIMYFLILRKEVFVGEAQTIGLLLGTIGSIISITTLRKHSGFYWIGALGFSIGLAGFALFQNLFGLIFYIIVGGITTPFLTNWMSIVLLNSIDKVNKPWEEKYHFLLERDMFLGIARTLSMLFVPIVPIIMGILLMKYQESDSAML
jgi:YQGE family putative transporter